MRRLLVAPLLLGLLVPGCGYSEDEWQAQLAKYDALAGEKSDLEKELAEAKARVTDLENQLEQMGLKLQASGAEKDDLTRALEEYKKRAATLEKIKQRFEKLRAKLQKLTQLGLQVNIRNNRMVISLPGDVLFSSGRDRLRKGGTDILSQVADVIRGDQALAGRHYQVAGHTDNQKLNAARERFKDNWGLSLMRARTVLLYMVSEQSAKGGGGGLPPKRWHAAGFGATDPISQNDTKSGRQKNRRVELILMPNVEEMLDLKSLL